MALTCEEIAAAVTDISPRIKRRDASNLLREAAGATRRRGQDLIKMADMLDQRAARIEQKDR